MKPRIIYSTKSYSDSKVPLFYYQTNEFNFSSILNINNQSENIPENPPPCIPILFSFTTFPIIDVPPPP